MIHQSYILRFSLFAIICIISTNTNAQLANQRAENVQNAALAYMTADGTYYKDDNGNPAEGYGYWPFAHGIENLAAAYQRTRNTVYRDRMKSILKGIRDHNSYQKGTYKNDYYDDLEWLGLACFEAYKATGDQEYINAIHEIWGYIKTGYNANSGVMSWKKGCTPACYNSIGNSPAIIMALKLYELEGDAANLKMAKDIHKWMKANVLNAQGGIWDAPNNFNQSWQFSYNTGLFIGACLELNLVTGDQAYIDDAITASEFMMNYRFTAPGIFYLNEKGGGDGGLFKGIFARYFAEFVRLGNLTAAQKERYMSVIQYTGSYVWDNSVNKTTYICGNDWTRVLAADLPSHLSAVHLFESVASLNKVHVYQDINYAGRYSELAVGNYNLAQLQAWGVADNGITSFSIPDGVTITVYDNPDFTGTSKTFTSNTSWLADWNDKISSIKIEQKTGVVTLFNDVNFAGNQSKLPLGDFKTTDLLAKEFSDNTLTSIKVMEGFKALLYDTKDFTGTVITYTKDEGWLGNFNDKASSIKVRPNGTLGLNNTCFIQNRASGLFLDIKGGVGATGNGTAVIQAPYFGTTNQQFELTDRSDGSYSIIAKHSGKGLDVAGNSTTSGALIHQCEYVGSANQRFILVSTDNGYYKLIAEHDGMVLDVATNDIDQQLHQAINHNRNSAQWKLELASVILGDEKQEQFKFSIFPNPVQSELHIQSNEAIQSVDIYDLSGHLMISTNGNTIPVSNLKKGIYTIKVVSDTFTETKKIIIE